MPEPGRSQTASPPPPRELQLEVTGACNLRCPMCLVSHRPALGRSAAAMPFERFRELVDGLPGLRRLTLQGLGEPLLHPRIVDMVAYAAGRGVRVGFNSNGLLLTRARARALIDAGLGWLHVSVDAPTPEAYAAIRRGGELGRLEANVRDLMAVVREAGEPAPEIELVAVAMRRTLHLLPDLVRLTADWGVPRLWVQGLSHSFADADPGGGYEGLRAFVAGEALWSEDAPAETGAVMDAARALAAELGVTLRLPSPPRPPEPRAPGVAGCDWPWRSAYVTHRGEVQPCCMVMGAERATLGDLGESSFEEIWSGPAYGAFREALLTEQPPEVCRGCSAYRHVF
ncbi:radical SAM protein [Miltoncostaea marina]|uniref:radical SAM protein n=1 Tax=Miltoncostaea marina TaxID=2843215 RepID=UPI001C3C8A4F|nr:radical SAM protein [Miltoncostaea marina]